MMDIPKWLNWKPNQTTREEDWELTISNQYVVLHPLTFLESLFLSQKRNNKINSQMDFILIVVQAISNLTEKQCKMLPIQDILEIILLHRYTFLNDLELQSSPKIVPSDFFKNEQKEIEKNPTVKIGDYSYSYILTLDDCIKAEYQAKINKHQDFIGYYFIASGCKNGIKVGIDNIFKTIDNIEHKNQILELAQKIESVGSVGIKTIGKDEQGNPLKELSIATKGGEGYALPFREISNFHFGL